MAGAAATPLSVSYLCAMNDRQLRVIAGAESAVTFAFGLEKAPPRVTEAAKRLHRQVGSAKATLVKQLGAKNSRKEPRYSLNRAKTILLRKHLNPIAADGLVLLAGLPGIQESLRLPRLKDAPDKHLRAAERVRRIAEEHEQEFITERDYREDFLEKFDRAVQDVEAANQVDRGLARARYTRATRDMKEEHRRAPCPGRAGRENCRGVSGRPGNAQTVAVGEPSAGEARASEAAKAPQGPGCGHAV